MKRTNGFEADDGMTFRTAKECKEHERKIVLMRLVGLTERQIMAAIGRVDLIEVADALELAGNIISDKRRADGALRRNVKKSHSDPAFEGVTKTLK